MIRLLFGAYRAQIEVYAVEEAVALVPAVFLNRGLEVVGVPGVFGCEFLQVEAARQVFHGAQLLIHHAVEEYRAGTAVGAEISAGIVVHADHHVGLPEIKPRRTMAVAVYIATDEVFQSEELVAQPLCVTAVLLYDEGRMLGQTGLVHVFLVDVFGLLGSGVHRDIDGHPAVDP